MAKLYDLWKSYKIYQATLSIANAWVEINQICLNAVWKTNVPPVHIHLWGSDKDKTYEEVADKTAKLVKQPELEVDVSHVESHGAELSNKDLKKLEEAKVTEQTDAETKDEAAEEPQRFSIK
jgi:hypothetical protein